MVLCASLKDVAHAQVCELFDALALLQAVQDMADAELTIGAGYPRLQIGRLARIAGDKVRGTLAALDPYV